MKYLIAIAVILAAFAAVSFATTKTFRAEVTIAASPAEVWAVLTDTAAYPEWNPVFQRVDGAYAEGGVVKNHVRFPDGGLVAMDATVERLTAEKELHQSGGIPGVITFDHQWLLEPVEGGTRITQYEVDRGFYLWFWDSSWVEPAYEEVNEALKARLGGG